VSGAQPARAPVELYWQVGAGGGGREIAIHDLAGRKVRGFPIDAGTEGVVRWDGRDRDGHRLPAGLYFARLAGEPERVRARIVLLW
jgi:hypothetical protein